MTAGDSTCLEDGDSEEGEARGNLNTDDDQEHEPGQSVADQTSESVHLIGTDVTAVDKVEDLHEDEGVPDESEVSLLVFVLSGLV